MKTLGEKAEVLRNSTLNSADKAFWIGISIDLAVFVLFSLFESVPLRAQIFSFTAAVAVSFSIKSAMHNSGNGTNSGIDRIMSGFWIYLAILFLRGGLMASLIRPLSLPVPIAYFLVMPLSLLTYAAAVDIFVFYSVDEDLKRDQSWRTFCIFLITYSVLLRLFFLGLTEILHEEGYYWNYAQHLDWGYLDHPPLVGWVIWLTTTLLGDSEFALRLGGFILWFVGAYFCYALSKRVFNGRVARDTLLIFAFLPYYFSVSVIILPDSSLVACWAGCLYFTYRFVIDEKPAAALGVGLFMGAGMLSKYSIVLLGAAAIIFLIADRRSRRWLMRYEVYMAILLVGLLFLLVIAWNAHHEWASFVFQGPRRVSGSFDFSLPELVGSLIVLLTPTGVMAIVAIALNRKSFVSDLIQIHGAGGERRYHLLMLMAGIPFAVFLFFSLFRQTKLIWTGPVWLALLPLMARLMSSHEGMVGARLPVFGRRPWKITVVVLALLYGTMLHYMAIGLPGVPYPVNRVGFGWREMSAQIEQLVNDIEANTGERPLVVSMDKDHINSWLAFYRGRTNPHSKGRRTNSGAAETGGRHLFGGDSNMYQFWFPPESQRGKTLIIVGRKPRDLTGPHIDGRIQSGGQVQEITIQRDGHTIRRMYYRIVYGYEPG
jgi:dolichol-phosphate mannosyltransferase